MSLTCCKVIYISQLLVKLFNIFFKFSNACFKIRDLFLKRRHK